MIVVRCYAFISLFVILPSLGVLGLRHSSSGALLTTHELSCGEGTLSCSLVHADSGIRFASYGYGSGNLDRTRELPRAARAGEHSRSVLEYA